ncbi:MAG: acetoin utilization protein AcuC [Thermoleophilia bacterium]|nr:acetoin utilization protein AcuC [Thermoleophilia bacterium]
MRTTFVHAAATLDYDLGDDHPLTPVRRELAAKLIEAYGLLEYPGVRVVEAEPATDEQIQRVHAPAYVAAVRQFSASPALAASWEAGQWGLAAAGDTPAFAGMHEAAARLCGASITAAMSVWNDQADQAFCAGGGLHHAFANRAAGFCIYNDPAVAIQAMLDAGAERVAYIDVDVHHGDGTQWIFWEQPRVLTCSVHESGQFLFPGTGGLEERGGQNAPGSALNIPLPAHSGDDPYLRAVTEVIAPAVKAFQPDAIVTQNGADPHHADPLAHLQISMPTYPRLYRALKEIAGESAEGRWIALGGGGYTFDTVPRAWAMLFATMIGAELEDAIPAEWLAAAEDRVGEKLTATLLGDTEPEVPAEVRERADEEAHRVVDQARAMIVG